MSYTREEATYFGAGPAGLPTDVLQEVGPALLNYQEQGVGLAEISHRSAQAKEILDTLKTRLASYLSIPADFEILLMQGGGSGEFSATAQNLVGAWVDRHVPTDGDRAAQLKAVEALKVDYLVTGSWSLKASQEAARLLGPEYINIVANGQDENKKFGAIPDEKDWKLSKDAAMVYYCDNETVDGVEFPAFPEALKPRDGYKPIVVADMSSNILSRKIPFEYYSAIFFGAQKNLGSAGLTVVIIKKDLLGDFEAAKPKESPSPALLRSLGLAGAIPAKVFHYNTVAANSSLYNTLSILDVFIASEVLKASLKKFSTEKVGGQEKESSLKASTIYEALERHPKVFKVIPHKDYRSRMNICFGVVWPGADLDKKFISDAKAKPNSLLGLAGHRSVGGIRASNYNSITIVGAQKLAKFIDRFAEDLEKTNT